MNAHEVSDSPSLTPCARCGTYAGLSLFWGRELCHDCIERAPDLLRREVSPASLLAGAVELFPKIGLHALILHHLASLPGLMRSMAGVGAALWNVRGAWCSP